MSIIISTLSQRQSKCKSSVDSHMIPSVHSEECVSTLCPVCGQGARSSVFMWGVECLTQWGVYFYMCTSFDVISQIPRWLALAVARKKGKNWKTWVKMRLTEESEKWGYENTLYSTLNKILNFMNKKQWLSPSHNIPHSALFGHVSVLLQRAPAFTETSIGALN